jgi:hypothetical protein
MKEETKARRNKSPVIRTLEPNNNKRGMKLKRQANGMQPRCRPSSKHFPLRDQWQPLRKYQGGIDRPRAMPPSPGVRRG